MFGELDLASESVFAGRYQIVRRLAAGGMGAVFEVVHIETRRRRALKVMLPELLQNAELRARFLNEAKVTANVESEYIVDVSDAGIDTATGMPFLVMELLQGRDLGKLLESGPLTAELALTLLRQVASALDKTHRAGIIHRDLKPENLFFTRREDDSPRIKVLDFGISKVVTDARTGSGVTRGIGTPLYMAPEQVLAQPISAGTDLYALALITYTLLVGVPYWQDDAERFDNSIGFLIHTSRGVVESASERARRLGRTLPAGFDAWFARGTSLNAKDRFQSAGEQVAALAQLFGVQFSSTPARGSGELPQGTAGGDEAALERTVPVKTPGTAVDWTSASPARRRPKWAAWLLATAAAAALAGAGLLASRSRTIIAPTPEKAGAEPSAPSGQTAIEPEARAQASSAPSALDLPHPNASAVPSSAATVPAMARRPSKPAAQPKNSKPPLPPQPPPPLYTRD